MRQIGMLVMVVGTLIAALAAGAKQGGVQENSLGMRMVRIPAGGFIMGCQSAPLPDELLESTQHHMSKRPATGDWDESPAHKVVITHPFLMSQTEVTIDQFRRFQGGYKGNPNYAPFASGISWREATSFCRWLSKKEGKTYRLPTEAEWEYACRAGTKTPFPGGMKRPNPGEANPWGLKNMQTGVLEWVNDWYGAYPSSTQTDPVGPASGYTKVVRGGGFDIHRHDGTVDAVLAAYFARSSNRASMAPSFGPAPVTVATGEGPGQHAIGFRVVQAEMPLTRPLPYEPPLSQIAVKQTAPGIEQGPDSSKPYYRTRRVFLFLGKNVSMQQVGWKLGIPRGMGIRYHNTALVVMPNGDMLAAYYNSPSWEDDPRQTIICLRRRFGSDEWDTASPWPDFADAPDAGPVFWNDHGKVWFFFGSQLIGTYPFQFMTSTDNGASWSQLNFPRFDSPVGKYTPQPINSVVRTPGGTIYLPVDGIGPHSVLFASKDNGLHWYDTGGRTGGRHTSLVVGKDGTLMGFGGKNSDIDGFMPLSTSDDGGKTYKLTKLPFSPLGSGQRPSVIRLTNGDLFFVADAYSSRKRFGRPRKAIAAISKDEGKTWHVRQLEGGNTLGPDGKPVALLTVGYATATQGPNGVIHIITSNTLPNHADLDLEIELNEAWVLSKKKLVVPKVVKMRPGSVKSYQESYPNGKPRVTWSAGTGEDGRYLLDGLQVFYYANGHKQWQTTFAAGRKIGVETYWRANGEKAWEKTHRDDGSWIWKVWGANGNLQAESEWHGKDLVKYQISH